MPAHRLDITALPGYFEIIETAWATGTDPLELLRLRPEFRSGAMNRAVRAARKAIRAAKVASLAERRAQVARERQERLDSLGRLVRCAGGWITERERDTVRACLDVKGALTRDHMERAGAYLDGNRWVVDDLDWESAAGGY